jgi:hypothetical protein
MEFVTERIRSAARRRSNSQIKKFLNLPGPPPFYRAHHRERVVTGTIFKSRNSSTYRNKGSTWLSSKGLCITCWAFATRRTWCATIRPAVHHWFHGCISHSTPCSFGCYGRCFASVNFGGATIDVAWSQHICAAFQRSHGHARTRLVSMGSCHQGQRQRWQPTLQCSYCPRNGWVAARWGSSAMCTTVLFVCWIFPVIARSLWCAL